MKIQTEVLPPVYTVQHRLIPCHCTVLLSSRSIRAAPPSSSLDSPVLPTVSAPVDSDTKDIPSLSSMPSLHSSSSLSDEEDDRSEVTIPFSGEPSFIHCLAFEPMNYSPTPSGNSSASAGSIASTTARSVRNVCSPASSPL